MSDTYVPNKMIFFTIFAASIASYKNTAVAAEAKAQAESTSIDGEPAAATETVIGHDKFIHNASSASLNIRSYYANTNLNKNSAYAKFREDNELTLLDLFGERAKELLTQHIIPSTDNYCRWDWQTGRCEPYCECNFMYLWGDYHLGRSCRYRTSPPPTNRVAGEDGSEQEVDETSWQEAWQEVWQSQLRSGGDSATFVPPLFPKKRGDSEGGTDAYTCNLPPETRYMQIMHQLSQALSHSTIVVDQLLKIKHVSSIALDKTKVQGQRQFMNIRHSACETVKRKIHQRAQDRDQPVVLTKQGATWIRRVCGNNEATSSEPKLETKSDDDNNDRSDGEKDASQ